MERVLAGLSPEKVFYWFEQIAQIPHGSYHEKALSDYLKRFAEESGYPVEQDDSWNLKMEIPATAGLEAASKTILQAHIDMVCKKDEGCPVDMEKDPLQLYVDGDWLKARGTTLGADNGIAVAMILALVDQVYAKKHPELCIPEEEPIPHPPLQILFTTVEEVACTGAGRMDASWPDGKYLINMDNFWEDTLMVSCAGISIHDLLVPVKKTPVPDGLKCFCRIHIGGLTGGHSGEVIHEGRANALAVLGELLAELEEKEKPALVEASGDGVFNSICTVSSAVLAFRDETGMETARRIAENLTKAYFGTDPGMKIEVQPAEESREALSEETRQTLIRLLYLAPSGMQKVFDTPTTQASSSSNFGSLALTGEETPRLRLVMSIRSNLEFYHDEMIRRYQMLTELLGVQMVTSRRICSWEYEPESHFRDLAAAVYEEETGAKPKIVVVHAGVEIASILGKMAECGKSAEAVSFGCLTIGCHTPQEKVSIASTQKIYRFLKGLILAIGKEREV